MNHGHTYQSALAAAEGIILRSKGAVKKSLASLSFERCGGGPLPHRQGIRIITTIKQIALTLALIGSSVLLVSAQTARVSTVNITAEADKVHVSAQGDVGEMRVDVSDEAGGAVFQSGAITGGTLDWKMVDAQGERVTPGTYLVTVTFHDAAGKFRKRVEQVTVEEAEKASPLAPAAPAATPSPVAVKTSGTVTAGRLPKIASVGATTATITNSVITESAGRIGIGTSAPATRLHLFGTNSRLRLQSTAANQSAVTEYVTDNATWHTGVGGSNVPDDVKGKYYIYDARPNEYRMMIDANGNVGIGTALTSYIKLNVFTSDPISTAVRGDAVGYGVVGVSSSNYGIGVFGQNADGGYAGYFNGKVTVAGALEVTSGLTVTGGCTGCTISSDQSLKSNFSAINPRLVLDRLAALPIKAWNYKRDEPSVRHIGPMAQDFRAAFNLGLDDKHIDMVDANGVTMAAIQGLYQQNQELIGKVEQQSRQITGLQARLNQMERTMKGRRTMRRR
jgi:hypothetical protein